jgi:hypothetical protein
MDFDLNEIQQFSSIMRHTFFGLHSDNLIEGRFEYGNGVKYFSGTGEIEDAGVVCQPSGLGVDVFLWAHGKGMLGSDAIFAQDFAASVDKEIVEISDARPASRAQHT